MNYDEMLQIVFSECYTNGKTGRSAYKQAHKNYLKLLNKYELGDEEYLERFKSKKGFGAYDFAEKDVQLLQFMKEIDYVNDNSRANASDKHKTLEKFSDVANTVKDVIRNNKYPAINGVLKSTLRTSEFLSVCSLTELVKKITLIFKYACQNNYADFKIYDELNEHLDKLLYTYAGHPIYTDFFNEMYYKKNGEAMPHLYNDNANSVEYIFSDGIGKYKGVEKYIQDIFDVVTKNDNDSIIFEGEETKYAHSYVFKFESIEDIKEFFKEYLKYFDLISDFTNTYYLDMFNIEDDDYSKIILSVNCTNLYEGVKDKIIPYLYGNVINKQIEIDCVKGNVKRLIDCLCNNILLPGEFKKRLKTDCQSVRAKQCELINQYMYTYGDGDFLRLNDNFNTVKQKVLDPLRTTVNNYVYDCLEVLFFDGLVIPQYTWNNNLESNAHEFLFSYKYFNISLFEICKLIKADNSNKDIVNGLISVLSKIDELIDSDIKTDNELYSSISNAVGIYLEKLSEENSKNESKEKQ